jgi:hypothetical protein
MTIDKQRLLHLIQDLVLQILRAFALEKIQAERVNCADEHLGHAGDITERLASSGDDALFQLRGCLVRKGKRDDIPRQERLAVRREQLHYATRDHFCFARACARNELEIAATICDGFFLTICQFHARALIARSGGLGPLPLVLIVYFDRTLVIFPQFLARCLSAIGYRPAHRFSTNAAPVPAARIECEGPNQLASRD